MDDTQESGIADEGKIEFKAPVIFTAGK